MLHNLSISGEFIWVVFEETPKVKEGLQLEIDRVGRYIRHKDGFLELKTEREVQVDRFC